MNKIKVILLKDIVNLGKSGEIKVVAKGYAKNFLFPTKSAELATAAKIKAFQNQEKLKAELKQKQIDRAKKIRERLKDIVLELKAPAEKEHLFGSVGPKEIVQSLKDKKIEISEKEVVMDEHIKTIGEHEVLLDLGNNIKAKVRLVIKPQSKKEKKSKAKSS